MKLSFAEYTGHNTILHGSRRPQFFQDPPNLTYITSTQGNFIFPTQSYPIQPDDCAVCESVVNVGFLSWKG